jgi:hypothetical protein
MNAALPGPVIAGVVFAPLAFIRVGWPVSIMGYTLTAMQSPAVRE